MTGILLGACVTTRTQSEGSNEAIDPPRGYVAADEPRAAQVGRDMLRDGGNAVDAAAAMALMMTATLPSRVGLNGGGVCLAFNADKQTFHTLDFLPRGGDAANGALLRAMSMLHARAGKQRWGKVIVAAEQEALRGVDVSRALRNDVKAAGGAPFTLPANDGLWVQNELGATLSQARRASGGAGFGAALAQAATGGAAPQWRDTVKIETGDGQLHFPILTDGPSAATLQAAWAAGAKAGAGQRAAAAASVLTAQTGAATAGSPGASAGPPGATVVAMDRYENVVACALTMGGLFGTGKTAPGTGALIAKPANGAGIGLPALFANPFINRASFAGVGAAQGGDGPLAGAMAAFAGALPAVLDDAKAPDIVVKRSAADPGRLALITCQSSKDGMWKKCQAANDPRAAGGAFIIESPRGED